MSKRKKIYIIMTIMAVVFYLNSVQVYAASQNNRDNEQAEAEERLKEYDFKEIDKALRTEDIDFESTIKELMTGNSEGIFKSLFENTMKKLFGDLDFNRKSIIKIILIAIASTIFSNMSLVLKKTEMTEAGFYTAYILLITVVLGSFYVVSGLVTDMLENVLIFMNALIPSFFLAVGVTSGSGSAVAFSQIVFFLIMITENVILKVIIPAIRVYIVILLTNNVIAEDYFSKFAKLIRSFVQWALKGMITVIMGANVLQGMISPSVSKAGTGILSKLINIIPGGNTIAGVRGIVMATENIIKNAIGGAGMIVLLVIVAFPMLKMMCFMAMYRITGAVIEPVSDKRIGKSVDAVADAIGLLYRVTFTVVMLFFVTIAIVCYATNVGV